MQPRVGTDSGATTPTLRDARPYSRDPQRRAATCFQVTCCLAVATHRAADSLSALEFQKVIEVIAFFLHRPVGSESVLAAIANTSAKFVSHYFDFTPAFRKDFRSNLAIVL